MEVTPGAVTVDTPMNNSCQLSEKSVSALQKGKIVNHAGHIQ